MFFIIASAAVVSAQSNFNCSVYTRLSVPGDMVRLINIWGNDSHAQFGNMSDYDYSVACKSNITTINTGCTGNFQEIAQLYSGNDSHVSIDDFYPYGVCFNTSDPTLAWYYSITARDATPADYECVFSIGKYNDTHVWECDNVNADFNINLKINSTLPPYAGCVDLDNATTFQDKVINNSNGYWFNRNASLCRKTYYKNDGGSVGVVIVNASYLTLDCNSSTLIGDSTGTAFYASGRPNTTLTGCNASLYNLTFRIHYSNDAVLTNVNAQDTPNVGFYVANSNRTSFYNVTSHNSTSSGGIVVDNSTNITLLGFVSWNNLPGSVGMLLQVCPGANISNVTVYSSGGGLSLANSPRSQLSNMTFWNNTVYGVSIASINVTMERVFSRDTTDNCIDISSANDSVFRYMSAWNCSGRGVSLYDSHRNAVYNVTSWNSSIGVYSISSDRNRFSNLTLYNNTNAFRLYDSNFTNVTNSSFTNSSSDAVLIYDSFSNLFYYDRFVSSAGYHATSNVAGNFFNTTNGSSCGPNCSRGNYWDDILTLDIIDLNGDGFGDTGTQYPYNSTYSSKVNVNVTDYGPITTKGCIDSDGDGFYPYSASPACPGTYRDCDDNNATLLPPYDGLSVMQNTTLCNGTYYVTDVAADGVVSFGADNLSITCNGTVVVGDSTGYGFRSVRNSSSIAGCTAVNYSDGFYAGGGLLFSIYYVNISNCTSYGSSNRGFFFGGAYGRLERLSAHDNGAEGVVIGGVGTEADWWNVSYLTLYNNTDGLYIYDSNGVNVSHVESSNNTDDGIDLRQYADYAVFYNLSSHNNGGNGLYSDLLGNGQGAGRVTSSSFYSNAGYGIRSNYLLRYNFTTLQVYGNALGGINSYGSSGSMCTNLSVYSNTGAGLTLNYSYGARVVGGRVYNNSIAGLRLYESGSSSFWGNTTVSDAVIYNNTMFGIYADGTNFDYMINMTVQNATMDNHTYGMYFNKTFNCTVRNSTVLRSTFGVYLKNSTDNLFYFNNFTASASYHAYSDKAGNYFNTTNGSGCGALCARGNYWDDILSLDIYDSNADGFGDAGTEYPYNATYSAMVSVNVTDWGPITTKGPPAPPAAASMLIVGPNGTEITGTRNVLINITFGTGIACRWANDNESNLTSMPWENCTTVKPWILSESEGNKTVYMEVLAPGGATSAFNDSIMYRFMQDYTPPTAPVVYDSDYGYDVDWWNDNATIGAYWWNATDDISTIYYKYRLLNDSGCYNGDCSWTDVGTDTDVTVTGLSLQEGWNMSFEVLAYTSSGMNSSVVSSNGTKIDLTGPTVPNINSSTHPRQDVSYDNATIRFNFTATDALSGIDGYSYLLDQYPGTAPDDNKEGRYWELLESSVNDGHGQLLRANSSVGSPNTYAVFSQLKQNFTAGERIRVRAALAEIGYDTTDDMSIKVYLISGADGFAPTFAVGPAVTTVSNVTRDIRYADGMALAALYEFDLTVNGTINDNVNDTYVVITGVTGDNDNRNNLSIAYSTTSVDNSTKNYVCPDSGACTENTNTLDYAIEVKREDSGSVWDVQYDDVRDGTYYFHVKAKDVAGNWGDTAHYAVIIDTAGVAVDIISPFSGQVFSAENVTVRVKVSENANVTVIALHPDGSNFTAAPKIFTGTDEFNVTLENGTNEIYAYAINPINNVVSYAQSVFVLFGDYLPAGRRTLRVLYPGSGCSGHICESPEAGATVGVAVENGSAIFGSNAVTSDTGRFTIKIFATNPAGLESDVESDLSDDQFLDRVHPLFGYRRGVSDYVVRNELRPLNIYLGGDRQVSEGKYTMVFRNLGTTPEGKVNISVRIV